MKGTISICYVLNLHTEAYYILMNLNEHFDRQKINNKQMNLTELAKALKKRKTLRRIYRIEFLFDIKGVFSQRTSRTNALRTIFIN